MAARADASGRRAPNVRESIFLLSDRPQGPLRQVLLGVVRFGNLCGAHVVGDAPADLNRTPRLECAIFPFPDIPAAHVDLEVDLVELFNDMFDFVRNELDRIVEPREVDINRHEHAFLAFHGRTRGIGRGASRQLLEQQIDAQAGSSG